MVDGWPLEAVCDHLEAVTFGELEPPRLLVNVPPGFMKSLIFNCFWPAWEWGPMNLPHLRYVAFSYTATLTARDNRRFLMILESQKYQDLYGDRFKLVKVGEELVSNDKTGWKLASSVGGVGTGERGNRVLVDDPHNVKEAESETIREGTVRWFQESIQNRLNDLDTDFIGVIMQRVNEGDVSGTIIDGMPEYTHLCIPWAYETGRHCETKIGWSDPRSVEGEPAWPERFSEQSMETFKRLPYLWAGQYQQRPSPRGGSIFRREWWELWDDPNGKYPPFDYVIASLDGAFTEKEENDPSALTVWAVWTDYPGWSVGSDPPVGIQGIRKIMLIDAWRKWLPMHGPRIDQIPNETKAAYSFRTRKDWGLVEWVAHTCRRWNVDRLIIENKASGSIAADELQKLYGDEKWAVQLDTPANDKKARALAVVSAFPQGLVYAPDRDWAEMVISEMESFPKGRHDDLTDSTTQALKHLRAVGLIQHPEERIAEEARASRHRPQRKNLYPV